MFKNRNRWFSSKATLSKTGAALLGLGILLTLISFAKGIQVLMFIPAFVLALFVYSYFDVRNVRKEIDFAIESRKKRTIIRIIFRRRIDFCTFGIVFCSEKESELLPLGQGLSVVVPAKKGDIHLSIHGKFNIIRSFVPLPDTTEAFQKQEEAEENQMEEVYFLLRPLQEGDDTKRIDARQSAKRGEWYVKDSITEYFPLRGVQHDTSKILQFLGSLPLIRQNRPYWGYRMEWVMIGTLLLAAHLEWRNWLFTLPALLSALFVFFWTHKELPVLGRKSMNAAALFLFFLSIFEGFKTGDPVVSGTHFLILLAIWKHFFKRERRDAFTYIFLALFVFVALSLYTLSAWFFFLFFAYLLQAMSIFTFFSSGERPEEYQKTFIRPPTRKSYIRMNAIVLLVTMLLFFVLPHGNREKQTDLIEKKSVAQTGFSENVSLNDIKRIKEDFSKKFLITDADPNQKELYENLYWRGVRLYDFIDNQWTRPKHIRNDYFAPQKEHFSTTSWNVKYFHQGEWNLFSPYVPVDIIGEDAINQPADPSILYFRKPKYNTADVQLVFAKDENGNPIDAKKPTSKPLLQPVSNEINATFSRFWESIPQDITEDPALLDSYIREQAGFSYSLENPAKSLEDFLYDSQQGHCELFASVLTLTLQHFGYPATFVNGYAGGEWNDSLGHWIVRGVNAHSWVEVYTPEGWYILDPTPASGSQSVFWYQDINWTQPIIRAYDVIELKYFEYFVGYTGEKQRQALIFLWRNKHIVLPALFFLILFFRYRKQIIVPIVGYAKKSPEERFLWWLKRKIPADSFVLHSLRENHTDLVEKTREVIYGKNRQNISLKELKEEWRKALKKRLS